jgi:MFS family permease
LLALRASDGREEAVQSEHASPAARPRRRFDPLLVVLFVVFAAIYAFITSLQLHFHAFQTDSGRSAEAASRLLSTQILVGAIGAPLFGVLAERTSARTALVVCASGLAISAGLVWNVETLPALTAWAVFHGLVNSGVVAVLALVLHEVSGGAERIGRRLGALMSVCMGATVLGNQWSAWMFDQTHSYVPAWQVYTGMMVVTAAATVWLRRAR